METGARPDVAATLGRRPRPNDRPSLGRIGRRMRQSPTILPAAVLWLGLAPLAGAALIAILGGVDGIDRAEALRATIGVAAVMLSFLGGIRFGMAMRVGPSRGMGATTVLSALPAILGWIATLLAPMPALCLLAAGFAGQGVWDVWTADRGGAPSWYGKARLHVTIAATLVLAATALFQGAA